MGKGYFNTCTRDSIKPIPKNQSGNCVLSIPGMIRIAFL